MTCLPLPSPGGWALSPGVGGWAGGGRLGSSRDAPDLVVAGAAVDRAVAARDERDLGHYAALGAGGRVHLARRLAAKAGEDSVADVAVLRLHRPRRASRRATAGTAGRLVLQPLGCVELLLAAGEDGAVATVLADDFLVNVGQLRCNLLGSGRGKPCES